MYIQQKPDVVLIIKGKVEVEQFRQALTAAVVMADAAVQEKWSAEGVANYQALSKLLGAFVE